MRVREALQGGAAAVLPPEARSRLMDVGRRLGLRPFDISLIVAIVQDESRVGGRGRVHTISADFVSRLAMVPGTDDRHAAVDRQPGHWWAAWLGATLLLSAAMGVAAAAWLLR